VKDFQKIDENDLLAQRRKFVKEHNNTMMESFEHAVAGNNSTTTSKRDFCTQ